MLLEFCVVNWLPFSTYMYKLSLLSNFRVALIQKVIFSRTQKYNKILEKYIMHIKETSIYKVNMSIIISLENRSAKETKWHTNDKL